MDLQKAVAVDLSIVAWTQCSKAVVQVLRLVQWGAVEIGEVARDALKAPLEKSVIFVGVYPKSHQVFLHLLRQGIQPNERVL